MDRIVVQMPDVARQFLMAMPIVQDYLARLAIGAERKERDVFYDVTFRMDDKFKLFEPCLKVVKENTPHFDYTGWNQWSRSEFDCFIKFDFDKAAQVVKPFNSHISEGLGVLVGVGPLGVITGTNTPKWPNLRMLKLPKKQDSNIVVAIENFSINNMEDKLLELLKKNYPDIVLKKIASSILREASETNYVKKVIDACNDVDIIIGPSSLASYMAATLNKALIEVFESKEEAYLYGNDGITTYRAIVGKDASAEWMFSVFEGLWESYQDFLSAMNKENVNQMEQSPSTVNSVEEK